MQSAPRIPPMTVTEVYNALVHLQQIGTRAQGSLDGKIHKLPAPVISDTLTYVCNLCIQAKLFLLSKSGRSSDLPPSFYLVSSLKAI